MARRFLVTGGAGYVGSHLVAALVERGDTVVVLDNLRTGHRTAVPPDVRLVVADLADAGVVDELLADGPWHAVFHFAALSQVGESMRQPFRYLIDNTINGMTLIEACVRHGVTRFVLSSTAAVYGTPTTVPIPEDAPFASESPYGDSKWFLERALHWADRVMGCAMPRCATSTPPAQIRLGGWARIISPETHLIPLVIDAALGRRAELEVFGDDYPTSDGTCLRDYVHVTDLADAHLLAVDRIEAGSIVVNLGCGTGHSVLQVIDAVQRVAGRKVPYRIRARRPGDPAALVASSERARAELGWRPRFADLDEIVRTALLGARHIRTDMAADTSRSTLTPIRTPCAQAVASVTCVGYIAVVASAVERISAGLFRFRHVPVAGGQALCRLGPADLLQSVPVSFAPDAHHLAGDRRAGIADRAYVAPGAPNAASRRVRVVAGAVDHHTDDHNAPALVCHAARTGRVHRLAHADNRTPDIRSGTPVAA